MAIMSSYQESTASNQTVKARNTLNYNGNCVIKSYNSGVYPVEIRNDTTGKFECERHGGDWVKSYKKRDGTMIHD